MIKNVLILSLLTIAGVAACAPNSGSDSSNGQNKGGPTVKDAVACYPGVKNQVCFAAADIATLPEQKALYNYPDADSDPEVPDSVVAQYRAPERVLPLKKTAPSTALSPNFKLSELMPVNSERGYYAIFSPMVVTKLEGIRAKIARPMLITSGFRSPGHNARTPNAARFSRHMYGDGVDFHVDGISYEKLATICKQYGAEFTQLYVDHIHCDWRTTALPEAFFPAPTVPLPPLAASSLTWNLGGHIQQIQPLVLAPVVAQEDEGELVYQWTVRGPNGYFAEHQGPQLELPNQRGHYEVTVVVGGSSVIQQVISIP